MPKKDNRAIYTFATERDYMDLLSPLEEQIPLKYILFGLFNDLDIPTWIDVASIPKVGKVKEGATIVPQYLVVKRSANILPIPIPQRRGGVLYAIDQSVSSSAIIFCPGGRISEECLIAGAIGTSSPDHSAVEMYNRFSKAIRSKWTRIKVSWLGPEALELFDSGVRFITDEGRPQVYDLTRD